jgi:hypothetical protein
MRVGVDAASFRPSRLNFAGVCIWCGIWQCQSRECAARHEVSWWAPCEGCRGGTADDWTDCHCSWGISEVPSQKVAEQEIAEFLQFIAATQGGGLRRVA